MSYREDRIAPEAHDSLLLIGYSIGDITNGSLAPYAMYSKFFVSLFAIVLIMGAGLIDDQLEHFTECTSRTGGNATLIVPEFAPVTVDDTEPSESDEIAVFSSDDVCVGATKWQDRSFAITIWEADARMNMQGVSDGEDFHLRIWKAAEDTEYSAALPSSSFVLSDEEPYLTSEPRYHRNAIYLLDTLRIDSSS